MVLVPSTRDDACLLAMVQFQVPIVLLRAKFRSFKLRLLSDMLMSTQGSLRRSQICSEQARFLPPTDALLQRMLRRTHLR